jgi:hypothetical protein
MSKRDPEFYKQFGTGFNPNAVRKGSVVVAIGPNATPALDNAWDEIRECWGLEADVREPPAEDFETLVHFLQYRSDQFEKLAEQQERRARLAEEQLRIAVTTLTRLPLTLDSTNNCYTVEVCRDALRQIEGVGK